MLHRNQAVARRQHEGPLDEFRRGRQRVRHSQSLFLNREASRHIEIRATRKVASDLLVVRPHDEHEIPDAVRGVRHQSPLNERPPEYRDHRLAPVRGHRLQPRPETRSEDHRSFEFARLHSGKTISVGRSSSG